MMQRKKGNFEHQEEQHKLLSSQEKKNAHGDQLNLAQKQHNSQDRHCRHTYMVSGFCRHFRASRAIPPAVGVPYSKRTVFGPAQYAVLMSLRNIIVAISIRRLKMKDNKKSGAYCFMTV
ncbi:MAG: hypothetical protein P8184_08235 [Calditrichia bacterium]